MRYELSEFDILDQEFLTRLGSQGITDTVTLLEEAGHPTQRAELSGISGVSEASLREAAKLADFARVRGIGPKLAQLMLSVPEIDTVQDLSESEAETLRHRLENVSRRQCSVKRIPSTSSLATCIENAGMLEPRLALAEADPEDFADRVKRLRQKERTAGRPLERAMLLTVLAVALAAFLLYAYLEYRSIPQPTDLSEPVEVVLAKMYRARYFFRVSTAVSVALLLFLCAFLGIRLWTYWSNWQARGLVLALFRRPLFQQAFLRFNDHDLSDHVRALWIALGAGAILVGWMIVSAIRAADLDALVRAIRPAGHGLGTIMVVVAFIPDVSTVLRVQQSDETVGAAGVQRFLLWRLINVGAGIGMLLIMVYILLPQTMGIHRCLVSRCVTPTYIHQIEHGRDQVGAAALEATGEPAKRHDVHSLLTEEFIENEIPQAMLTYPDGTPWEARPLRLGGSMAIWMLSNAFLFYFVAPFVMAGEPLHALFFIALTAVSYFLEDFLEALLPDAFFLPSGSLAAIVLLAVLILANTVFFDVIYEQATEKYHLCPFCHKEVEVDDRFCPSCGAEQHFET